MHTTAKSVLAHEARDLGFHIMRKPQATQQAPDRAGNIARVGPGDEKLDFSALRGAQARRLEKFSYPLERQKAAYDADTQGAGALLRRLGFGAESVMDDYSAELRR